MSVRACLQALSPHHSILTPVSSSSSMAAAAAAPRALWRIVATTFCVVMLTSFAVPSWLPVRMSGFCTMERNRRAMFCNEQNSPALGQVCTYKHAPTSAAHTSVLIGSVCHPYPENVCMQAPVLGFQTRSVMSFDAVATAFPLPVNPPHVTSASCPARTHARTHAPPPPVRRTKR